ncbi:ornithine cyclodeaminase family protein [Enterococcus sp. AZ072]|uniref:ornithine cyclodeaminase family protein n=1 Tax=unclassified Enterococcus TaxID=2608891 RepID=UPI003D2CDC9F
MSQELLVLDAAFVEEHLDMQVCVDLMAETLKNVETGEDVQYLRNAIKMPNDNILGLMPGYSNSGYFGTKILSVYLQNSQDGYPSHQGQILIFEKEHGQLKGIVDATSVTKLRTGAVSAAASTVLANPDSSKLALLGAGEQGESHLQALLTQFTLTEVTIWDKDFERAQRFAERESTKQQIAITACPTSQEAVQDADIVCTITPAKTPIIEAAWLKPGVHINAVGACTADTRELATDIVQKARFFGDNGESVLHEAGDFLIPLNDGAITNEHYLGTIGQVMQGTVPGRLTKEDITVFEALGMAVEDLAVANYLCQLAKNQQE